MKTRSNEGSSLPLTLLAVAVLFSPLLGGCGTDDEGPSSDEAAATSYSFPVAGIDEARQDLDAVIRAADANGDGVLTRTEARRAAAGFETRSHILASIESSSLVEGSHVAVSTLETWNAADACELEAVNENRNAWISPGEAARAESGARRLFVIAKGDDALFAPVPTSKVEFVVSDLEKTFDAIAQDGVLVRTAVLEASLSSSRRFFLLDVLDGVDAIQPHLGRATFVDWLRAAETELVKGGDETVTATKALDCSGTARRLFSVASKE